MSHLTGAALLRALQAAVPDSEAFDWNAGEQRAYESLTSEGLEDCDLRIIRGDVYLGGDALRPYLTVRVGQEVAVVAPLTSGLSLPRKIQELRAGINVEAQDTLVDADGREHTHWRLRTQVKQGDWVDLPRVYLSTLTNASRYRARRFPLNVARLAQWIRFQHVGRAHAVDLALDFDGNIDELASAIAAWRPDVLGISLNFGELSSLRVLIAALRATDCRPVLCLGNVLAVWASIDVEEVCAGFRCIIAPSYGESVLDEICSAIIGRELPEVHQRTVPTKLSGGDVGPSAIVVPDERLLLGTLEQEGQASLETSFGCQYGHCTFCPRDHRGRGWRRPTPMDAVAVIKRMGRTIARTRTEVTGVLSIVDEDGFGQEGRDPEGTPFLTTLVAASSEVAVRSEVYTRAEQILDETWTPLAAIRRIEQLTAMRPSLSRLFIGVESGSDSQLKRYGKGQTVRQIVVALRAGSLIGLPMEFGFITFDPLLRQRELAESLEFLARCDVVLPPDGGLSPQQVVQLATMTEPTQEGAPVFLNVAYLATELELFVNSPFLAFVRNTSPALVGAFDSRFARHEYTYEDASIQSIAGWCRVWTEGAFEPVYRMRLAARSGQEEGSVYRTLIERYRHATYGLLLALSIRQCDEVRDRLLLLWERWGSQLPMSLERPLELSDLNVLWTWVLAASPAGFVIPGVVHFRTEHLESRRDT